MRNRIRPKRPQIKVAKKEEQKDASQVEVLAWLIVSALLVLLQVSAQAEGTSRDVQVHKGNPNTKTNNDAQIRKAYDEFRKKNAEATDNKKDKNNKDGKDEKGQDGKDRKDEKKINDAEYKEKIRENAAFIKELFQKAEAKLKEEQYREAASFYASVVMSNVPNTEKLVEESRKRFLEMEDMAKEHMKNAEDLLIKRSHLNAIEELSKITKEFPFTNSFPDAQQRLVSLKTNPTVSGLVEYAQAETHEAGGELLAAIKIYQAIADNPRYEGTLASMKARRKVDLFDQDAAIKEKMKEELNAQAEQEAPRLMAAADNCLKNNMSAMAKEKLDEIVEKYPGTRFASEAEEKLTKLP